MSNQPDQESRSFEEIAEQARQRARQIGSDQPSEERQGLSPERRQELVRLLQAGQLSGPTLDSLSAADMMDIMREVNARSAAVAVASEPQPGPEPTPKRHWWEGLRRRGQKPAEEVEFQQATEAEREKQVKRLETIMAEISKNLLEKTRQNLPTFMVGFVGGMAGRGLAQWGLASLMVSGGLPAAAAVGAMGGLVAGLGKEWARQFGENLDEAVNSEKMKEYYIGDLKISIESPEIDKRKIILKENLRLLKVNRKGDLAKAALVGAASGALGGMTMHALIDVWQAHFGLATVLPSPETGEAGISESAKAVPSPAPAPLETVETASPTTETATAAPTPQATIEPSVLATTGPQPGGEIDVQSPVEISAGPTEEYGFGTGGGEGVAVPPQTEVVPGGIEGLPQDVIGELNKLAEQGVVIPEGSNPWNETTSLLEKTLGHPASNSQILEATKVLCAANHIAVPEWGLGGEGWISDRAIPAGMKLQITPEVADTIKNIALSR